MSWEPSRGKSQESNTHKNVTWKLLGPPPVLPRSGTVESEPRAWGRHRKTAGVMRKQMAYVRPECYCANQKAMPDTARTDRKAGGVSNCFCSDLQMETRDRPPGHCLLLLRGRSCGFNITLNKCLHLLGLEKLPRCCRSATILTLHRSSANP